LEDEDLMKKSKRLSHLDSKGQARMVDVSHKKTTKRSARAEAWINVGSQVASMLRGSGGVHKGNVLETARLAGMMAAKRTSDLIPMCHPLFLEHVSAEATLEGDRVHILTHCHSSGKTGVEMEAMTAAAVAALTVYDMIKSAGKGITIESIRLLEKRGGKSGTWRRKEGSHGQD
jgi:cyclic pyranopterin monophosphate synthase